MSDGTRSLAEDFERMAPSERIRICRIAAARARKAAAVAAGDERTLYLKVAEQWDTIAEELEAQAGRANAP